MVWRFSPKYLVVAAMLAPATGFAQSPSKTSGSQPIPTTQKGDKPVESRVLATNLFERIGDEWLMIHHHGSPVMG